jgi:hypothetical protein
VRPQVQFTAAKAQEVMLVADHGIGYTPNSPGLMASQQPWGRVPNQFEVAADTATGTFHVFDKTGKPLAHWRRILDQFGAASRKSNEVVAFLQEEHSVPRYWARTLTTNYLKRAGRTV